VATQRKRPRAYGSPACYLHELGPTTNLMPRTAFGRCTPRTIRAAVTPWYCATCCASL